MCKVYGYCRISRKTQNIERQERNIKAEYPEAVILKEAFTGTKIEGRKEFLRLLKTVKAGDTIVFDSVSRMSRNADEGVAEYKRLYGMGVELIFLKEHHIDTAVYKAALEKKIQAIETGDAATNKLANAIISAVQDYMADLADRQVRLTFEQAEKEVEDLHQRTKEGIETARLNGKQIGQAAGKKLVVKRAAPAKKIIREKSQAFGGTLTDAEVMKLAEISKPTFYKYKREIRQELDAEALRTQQEIRTELGQ